MKNFIFGFVALAVMAVVANDSFAGCRSCGGRSRPALRSRSCNASCASSCSAAKAPAAAPVAAAAPAKKVESTSSCASGSCGSSGLRGRLRLR